MALKLMERNLDVRIAADDPKKKLWRPMASPERIAMMKNLGQTQTVQSNRVTSLTIARSCSHRVAGQKGRLERTHI